MPARSIKTFSPTPDPAFETAPSDRGALVWCDRLRHPLRFVRAIERRQVELKRRAHEQRIAAAEDYWMALSSLDDARIVGLDKCQPSDFQRN